MNKKTKIILSAVVYLFMLAVVADNSFADNLADKYVYSLFNENFNGATQEAGTVYDNIKYNVWNGDGNSRPAVDIVADSTAKEGNKYYSCSISSTTTGWSGFCYTFVTGS